jgi:hypothetical protein
LKAEPDFSGVAEVLVGVYLTSSKSEEEAEKKEKKKEAERSEKDQASQR